MAELTYIPDLPDDPSSKVNMCVNNIARIWQEGQADKPFPQEQEYRAKSARLAELNAELNIDDKTPMEALAEPEDAIAKKPRQSILAKLKAPLPPPAKNEKPKEREVR